jgi:exodeoxyribonuclease V alpha subunit
VHRAFGAKGFVQDGGEREATYVGIVGESGKKSQANEHEEWGYGPKNPHPAKLIVVDESSMLDLHMLFRILNSTAKDARILFVGDPYQLPSVGSGDVLRDLIRSKCFAHAHLGQIFRQANTSGIVIAAHEIHAGRAPTPDGKDFVLIQADEEDAAAEEIIAMARKLYDRRIIFQVLSPRHGGDAGVTNLNSRLRMELNPAVAGVQELKVGSAIIREGDRIMVVKNDYELNVYNGDVGKVARIDRKAKQLDLKIFQGPGEPPRFVPYKFSDASKSLRLAYAQTVHKSQGQEYDVIVIPVLASFGSQLQRNLLYTAITRAKKKVFVVGTSAALARAVRNNQAEGRNTLLAERIQQLLGG